MGGGKKGRNGVGREPRALLTHFGHRVCARECDPALCRRSRRLMASGRDSDHQLSCVKVVALPEVLASREHERRGPQQERLPASLVNNTPATRSCCGKTRVTANSSLIFHLSLVPFPTATSCGVTQMRLNDDMPESRGTYRIVDHSDSYAHGHKGGESTG